MKRDDVQVVSCYELGHPPLAAASLLGYLEERGFRTDAIDLAVEPASRLERTRDARLVAISVPMHTALRLGVRAARRVREIAPDAHVCLFGHYAVLNADYLLGEGIADSVTGGECEPTLAELTRRLLAAIENETPTTPIPGLITAAGRNAPLRARVEFAAPSRTALPSEDRYARLRVAGEDHLAAAVEATRGCLHQCRHCPIPPVYDGRFFVVPREVVLADVDRLVERDVRHLTFADPDFLNGPRHAIELVEAIHARHPHLSFDVTTKVSNLLRHRALLPRLSASGCAFVVTAVESLNDRILTILDKGHTRADVETALALTRRSGLALRPTFVTFTPWTTPEDLLDLLDWVESEGLVDHVDPVQLSIRLLVPPGSLLLDHPAMRPHLREFSAADFMHRWEHPDPRMDRLADEIGRCVRSGVTFAAIRRRVEPLAAPRPSVRPPFRASVPPPRLTEPWFC